MDTANRTAGAFRAPAPARDIMRLDELLPLSGHGLTSALTFSDAHTAAKSVAEGTEFTCAGVVAFLCRGITLGPVESERYQRHLTSKLITSVPKSKRAVFLGYGKASEREDGRYLVIPDSERHRADLVGRGGSRFREWVACSYDMIVGSRIRLFADAVSDACDDHGVARTVTVLAHGVQGLPPVDATTSPRVRRAGVPTEFISRLESDDPPHEQERFRMVISLLRDGAEESEILAVFERGNYVGARRTKVLSKISDICNRYRNLAR